MKSNQNLAIVIPAYKLSFFNQTLNSINNQTCKDFTLYIGDDGSPFDIEKAIKPYIESIDIVYKRFENNIGRNDLIAHWNRCIEMTRDEEWIWLFSDDDLMENNCVELFQSHIKKHKNNQLLHFNIQVIDENNCKLYKAKKYPSSLSSTELFSALLNREVFSTAVEYIFKKDIFVKVNGFESFDLAWSSDNATWIKLAVYGGITTIEGATIKWRVSNLNISSISNDKEIVLRKAKSNIDYLNWATGFFKQNNLIDKSSELEKIRWLLIGIVYTSSLTYSERYMLLRSSLKNTKLENFKAEAITFWLIEEIKKIIKSLIDYKGY